MEFCSILPIKNSGIMFKQKMVMLLAHLSMDNTQYARDAAHYSGYKIMDNSIIELGFAFSMENLVHEAIKCEVNEIILPDVFNDGPSTIKVVKESIEWLKQNGYLGRFKLMAVCHGSNREEFEHTFISLKNIAEIDVIGLPKVLSTWVGSRANLARFCRENCDKELHLLGCWYTLSEYRDGSFEGIRSTDTCLPALLSIYGMGTWDNRHDKRINLEEDCINHSRYKKIMRELYANCSF